MRPMHFGLKNAVCISQAGLIKTRPMSISQQPRKDIHGEAFLQELMRRQLKLSVTCATAFLLALLGLPLLNYMLPELMAVRIGGFTLSWLMLGVLFFPLVWIISFYFIRRSIALEEAEVREVMDQSSGATSDNHR
ncbi:MAG: DUF485 domain-containing protein [Verrucomicrobia bacterium]|nr:DUF485 domain-containing protein [Verrucomicrobiota bacterium]